MKTIASAKARANRYVLSGESPIRGELFSVERLENFAAILAEDHLEVSRPRHFQRLLPRLRDNERVLHAAYRTLITTVKSRASAAPAAEWLIDNFFVVEEQLREIQEDLPDGFYRELPKLVTGPYAGFPRIYAIAATIAGHTDSRLEIDTLERFLNAYQKVTPLTIGELWAFAITLRFAMVENLRQSAARIVDSREERFEADRIADELIDIAGRQPEDLLAFFIKKLSRRRKLGSAFVEQLTRRLRDRDYTISAIFEWLEDQMQEQSTSIDRIVQLEYQNQAAEQITVGNIITSMRLLSTIDWNRFFENTSLVDRVLLDDPARVYDRLDFASRNAYREVLEHIAKRSKTDEISAAERVVALAREANRASAENLRTAHVGFYLVDDGRRSLEKALGYRPRPLERATRFVLAWPTLCYLGLAAVLTGLLVTLLVSAAAFAGASTPLLVFFALLSVIPASDLALSIANWDLTHFIPPRLLPQIETADGVPAEAKTMVVIPTLLADEDNVAELFEKLEIYSLANRDDNICFAILGDFLDADCETTQLDATIIESASRRLAALEAEYPRKFFFFHRRRQWNESEQKWMGWERKRGKLEEFNGLLRGDEMTSFEAVTATPEFLREFRYVITLDADTRLPRDAARKLIGIAEHPLNRPHFDERLGRVTKGYGILQPRIGISMSSSSRSLFARTLSGYKGVDPYTTASSDVYQDLFGEGSFTGKGIYDVDAFTLSTKDRVAENTLLSHDLFEGLYARCGLVTNVELLDDFPAYFDTYSQRSHRWTRGDWQIADRMLPWFIDADGIVRRNDLPLISRWKILDNLRRSLVAPAILLWLFAVWTIIPGSALLFTLFVLLEIGFPIYAHLQMNLLAQPRGVAWKNHFGGVWRDFRINTGQVLLSVGAIPHQAVTKTDAIIRTLYRKFVSKRRLLEWKTAATSEHDNRQSLESEIRMMSPAMVIALTGFGLIGFFRLSALPVAMPFLLLWLLSPFFAFRLGKRPRTERFILPDSDVKTARMIARRTWRFFERFVGDADNWLPPDNFQEDPSPKIAHRTSPTNIGLLLLSTVSAYDFGYVGTLELSERLGLTFATLDKLERYRGHFYNWYDTETLAPLAPGYVSTVDSGNFAGHLLALKQSVTEIIGRKFFDTKVLDGLGDSLELMRREAARFDDARHRTEVVSISQLRLEIDKSLELVGGRSPDTPDSWLVLLEALAHHSATINDITDALRQDRGGFDYDDLKFWATDLTHQIRTFRRDIDTFIPWREKDFLHLSEIISSEFPEIQSEWREVMDLLNYFPSLGELAELYDGLLARLHTINEKINDSQMAERDTTAAANAVWILAGLVRQAATLAIITLSNFNDFVWKSGDFVDEMKFGFLLDPQRKVFTIGHNAEIDKSDNSFYDLLASEARLTGFVAIAKGEIPQEHWFRLGRGLTRVDASRALISWTATMFEYLLPLLVMRDYDGTLLSQTYRAVVQRQIDYAAANKVPWGISESAYNARDLHLNYQYQAFGVPGLGLKRGLSEDLVIAPYATALAALVTPAAAMENFRALEAEGALARYGFYEAIDYTPDRLPPNQNKTLIRAFMAHHQGMILVALNNLVHSNVMQRRFHAEPLVMATELLLQERIPQGVTARHPRAEEVLSSPTDRHLSGRVTRVFDSPHLSTPRTQILSNGAYSVLVTNSGAGYSMCNGLAVTRWREDTTRDCWGSFLYLRDVESGKIWSGGYQPMEKLPRNYEVAFSEDKAVIKRRDGNVTTRVDIIVSPEDNAEIRRVSLTNNSLRVREIEVTSYAEIVLVPPAADAAHPAFSNLFIETEFNSAENSLIARRRPRKESDSPIWAVHTIATEGETVGSVQYETNRARFLGRGHDARDPVAVIENRPLSNTVGAVLDPIFSLRRYMRLQPHETVRVTFTTAVAESYEHALALADKYHDSNIFEREAAMAWTHSQVEMRHLDVEPENAYVYQRLASHIVFADNSLRERGEILAMNSKAQSDLWVHGIGGDLPIVLARISRTDNLPQIRQILNAHEYLRLKGLPFDLVILNDNPSSYFESLQEELLRLVRASGESHLLDKTGGIFLRRFDQIPEADRVLLHSAARVVIVAERGDFADEVFRKQVETDLPKAFTVRAGDRHFPKPLLNSEAPTFFNGLGGFLNDGREYVTRLSEGQWTPAPWLNVIANDLDFGFQVSETGAGFSWSENSRENRLTPWSNDAVSDPPGEVVYLRDEETGAIWTPTPLPIRAAGDYVIRHGQGYTIFEHESNGIAQKLAVFVPLDARVKISRVTLTNRSNHRRIVSATNYNELVLGFDRGKSAPYVVTKAAVGDRVIYARNPFNNEFAGRVAFFAVNSPVSSLTCDRKEFIGRNGSLRDPAALHRENLSGRSGAGLDPCAALQAVVALEPGETRELVFLLGQTASEDEAANVVARFSDIEAVRTAFAEVLGFWDKTLGTIKVRTPDDALNTLVNRWLPYQTLACRIWSRSAFYQSGGAYGFRDQLQDAMALVYAKPAVAREQIMIAAARQFKEGDVQHWWHPPTGRGVRTRFSDDLLWLPYVAGFYVSVTGDRSVLDETVPFLEAPPLEDGQDDAYILPSVSTENGTVLEHCFRAIERSLGLGEHGLPLMGSGDWNDGMSSVGNEGKGESVWLGWFLIDTLNKILPFCDAARAKRYRRRTADLTSALEKNAWDGNWFRRAYFDDGTPLGSAENDECKIDSIAQSWSVISRAGTDHQVSRAMASVDEYLVRRGDGIVMLFTPPFDKGPQTPGYVKGYIPGVRENGGQYTHAAIWTLMAFAMLGDGDKAGELFALLNPINHASTRAGLHKYKVEPYVLAGDVYAQNAHIGRGGWTWYTGAAGWMYRAAVETMLGFSMSGSRLRIDPCIPRNWAGFEMDYRFGESLYRIVVVNPEGVCRGVAQTLLDDDLVPANEIELKDDRSDHRLEVRLGERET